MRATLILASCALALGGCTRANLGFTGGGGNGGSGGSGGIGGNEVDLSASTIRDMTSSSGGADLRGASGDLALTKECSADARRCITLGGVASEDCSAAGQWQIDRRCPFGSAAKTGAMCASGYCDPPTANTVTGCGNGGPLEAVCTQMSAGQGQKFSCQPFITDPATTPAGVDWWCAVAANAGAGVAGAKCTLDSQCHTGFCASNHTCFWACQTGADCVSPIPPMMMTCADATITVEGKAITALSCIPN